MPDMTSPSAVPEPSGEEKIYRVGTLHYTQHQLYVLFFWLMWNDFTITLLEQVNQLTGFLYKDLGTTNEQLATFGTVTGLLTIWLNPVCSTWSDRTRTKYGRRRPFIFLATPFFAFFLMMTPYMPDFYHHVVEHSFAAGLIAHIPVRGDILFIFICGLFVGLFNSMVLAIFSYLYWDVVPANALGRFNALGKMVTFAATILWNYYFFGLGEHHMKAVFVGISIFCLVFYMISTWQIKEGDYPPPDEHKKGGTIAPIRAYLVECFSKSYFLWIFLGFTLYQLGNIGGQYQAFYVHYELGLNLDSIGKLKAVPMAISLVLVFSIGSLTDKYNPVRLMAVPLAVWALINFAGYFWVQGPWTFLALTTGTTLMSTINSIIGSALTVRIYPMEKLGQFCSASAISQQVTCAVISPIMGHLYDVVGNRFAFLWAACFQLAAALAFCTVWRNWKKKHGHVTAPHAG